MKQLQPDLYLPDVYALTPEFLKEKGIRGLILDIDNTLIPYSMNLPDEKLLVWLNRMSRENIALAVVSNGEEPRTRGFCRPLGIPYVYKALKPSLWGYREMLDELGLKPEETAAVGDQFFTDIWGARRMGLFAVLVDPIDVRSEGKFLRLKRLLEKKFRKQAAAAREEKNV